MSTDLYSSRPYKVGVSIASLLFLITLTTVIVILIIDNAREARQENEFAATLTAVWDEHAATQTAVAELTGSALGGPFALPFALAPGSLTLSAGDACTGQTISGQTLDLDGQPYPGLNVMIWGSGLAPVVIETAGDEAEAPGSWTLTLDGVFDRHIWIQLMSGDQPLSPPVAIVFASSDCERNHAGLVLRQTGPIDPGS